MKIKAKFLSFGLAAALSAGAGAASATDPLLVIAGSGLWASNAPVTEYSVPGETFSFSFEIPENYTVIYQDQYLSATTDFSDFHYYLNGVAVSATPDNIVFLDAEQGGGLALGFSDHSVELYGADLGSAGTLTSTQFLDAYPNVDATAINQGAKPAAGYASAVPEPAAWTMMLLGVAGVGGAIRRRGPLLAA